MGMTSESTESQGKARWPWLLGATVVVVVAVVVSLLLVTGHAGSGERSTPAKAAARAQGYDLSTPEAAAESLVKAAKTGSADALLDLTCVGRPACVREHAASVTEAALTEERDTISEGRFELAEHLKDAEFATAVDGDAPGSKEVPYRTPEMTGDAYLSLTFVRTGGDWLYYRPA